MNKLDSKRIDYFLIWGHGLRFQDDILQMIREHRDLRVIKILSHKPKSIKKLVKAVYSYDYAPFHHLKSKTRYLLKTPNEVLFIFIENNNPNEDYFGKGRFRHLESCTIKVFKEQIRNRFNDYIDDKRTEDHVVHASDNELQTHFILKYLGYEGIQYFRNTASVINLPYYLADRNRFTISRIQTEGLFCKTVVGDRFGWNVKEIPLCESPQYKAIEGHVDFYQEYIKKHLGGALTVDYSMERFLDLYESLEYLKMPDELKYITVRQFRGNRYIIVDGLHRAAILSHRGEKAFWAAIVD